MSVRGATLIKNVFACFAQFVLFFVIFAAFSFLPPLHLEHVVDTTADGPRVFIWDGLLIAAVLFVVILLIEAAMKRIRTAGVWTTVAFALAIVIGFAAKLGFKTNTSF
jgi:hypothetical protein